MRRFSQFWLFSALVWLLGAIAWPTFASITGPPGIGYAAEAGSTAAEDVTYLYQKVGAQGEHLKFGITKNPATRYTQEELGGGQLRILTEGPRKDMLQLERNLHETLPIGPEEAQKFYIQKQIEKELKPPPYNP